MSPFRSFPCIAFLLSLSIAGCAAPEDDAFDTSASDLQRTIGPGSPGGGGKILVGPVVAPPVGLPAYWDATGRTSSSVDLGWYEVGQPLNPQTLVYRHRYDLDGNAVGEPTLIKTFDNLPAGNAGFTDRVDTTDDHSGPDPDRINCYHLVEKNGACGPAPGGQTCLSTPVACAYTRAVTPHPIGRIQLRIKMSSAETAAAPGDHVQVRLQSPSYPYALTPIPRNNSTWIDSTQHDFVSGGNVTYDLKSSNISDLSDITQITVATPDNDGLCINELELLVDNTRAFFTSFGQNGVDCQWAWNSDGIGGSVVTVPFGALRRDPAWQGWSPPNLSPSSTDYKSFVGYRKDELIAYLDSAFGDALRNPANKHGDDAGFRDTNWTTTQWIGRRTLHVIQHVIAADLGWKGSVAADPSYDLVIHNDASCGSKHWCIAVENVNANSSFSGWSLLIVPLISAGIQIAVDSEANGQMHTAMTAMGGNALDDPPSGFEYCFPGNVHDQPFGFQGFEVPGSFTLCLPSLDRVTQPIVALPLPGATVAAQ